MLGFFDDYLGDFFVGLADFNQELVDLVSGRLLFTGDVLAE